MSDAPKEIWIDDDMTAWNQYSEDDTRYFRADIVDDLLEAATRIEKICAKNLYPCPDKPDSDWGALVQLRAAIAKAKGESNE